MVGEDNILPLAGINGRKHLIPSRCVILSEGVSITGKTIGLFGLKEELSFDGLYEKRRHLATQFWEDGKAKDFVFNGKGCHALSP
jgi:hypothetical protein